MPAFYVFVLRLLSIILTDILTETMGLILNKLPKKCIMIILLFTVKKERKQVNFIGL